MNNVTTSSGAVVMSAPPERVTNHGPFVFPLGQLARQPTQLSLPVSTGVFNERPPAPETPPRRGTAHRQADGTQSELALAHTQRHATRPPPSAAPDHPVPEAHPPAPSASRPLGHAPTAAATNRPTVPPPRRRPTQRDPPRHPRQPPAHGQRHPSRPAALPNSALQDQDAPPAATRSQSRLASAPTPRITAHRAPAPPVGHARNQRTCQGSRRIT